MVSYKTGVNSHQGKGADLKAIMADIVFINSN